MDSVVSLVVLSAQEWSNYLLELEPNATIDHGPYWNFDGRPASCVLRAVCIALYSALCVLGVLCNAWALRVSLVALRCGGRNVNVLTYIGALAFINTIICASLVLAVADMVAGEWVFPRFLCAAYWTMETVNKVASSLIVTCLAVACYCAVCQPRMVRMYRCAAVACAHLLAVFAIVAWKAHPFIRRSAVFYVVQGLNGSRVECARKCLYLPVDRGQVHHQTVDLFVCVYALPICYMLFFYVAILRAILAQSWLLGRRWPPRRFWKAARSACLLMAFHAATWTPYWSVTVSLVLAEHADQPDPGLHAAGLATHLLPVANAAFAPLLYTLSNGHVRTLYKAAAGARRQRSKIRRSMRGRQRAGIAKQVLYNDTVMETAL